MPSPRSNIEPSFAPKGAKAAQNSQPRRHVYPSLPDVGASLSVVRDLVVRAKFTETPMTDYKTKMLLVFPSCTEHGQISNTPSWFEIEVEVSKDTNLREVVLGLIDSIPSQFVPYRSAEITGNMPFDFATNYRSNWSESRSKFDYLPYGRFHKGGVEFLHVLRRANRSWSINELEWLRGEQLVAEVPRKLYVVFLQGLGAAGGSQEWVDTIFQIARDQTLSFVHTYLIQQFFKFVRRSRNSEIMQDWHDRGLDSVGTLDTFLDTREFWSPRDLSKLLRIWKWESTLLLSKRGFQQKSDKSWTKINQGSIDVGLADLV